MNVKMVVIQGLPAGKALRFPCGDYFLGRGPECHVRFNSDWVSRQHCLLRVRAEAVFLRDLGSRNGTLVNGERLNGEQLLKQGDLVQIGPVVFEVRLEPPPSGVEPSPPPSTLEPESPEQAASGQQALDSTANHPLGPDRKGDAYSLRGVVFHWMPNEV
jgi:pSer/pThr/pTyr-binding forkhead associated (FHA) protein